MTEPLSQTGLSLEHELQLDTLCVQFEKAWRHGHTTAIEEYLEQSDTVLHPALLKELLLIELDRLRQKGIATDPGDYHRRFPQWAGIVDAVFQEVLATDNPSGENVPPTEYEIISQLGTSREGLSYRAICSDDGSEVDIVVLNQLEPTEADRVKKRVRLARQLSHPSVARVLELNLNGDELSVVLEPAAQQRLSDVDLPSTNSKSNQLIDYSCQIASAVSAAHRLGLVHGELTPASIRVRSNGNLQIDFVRPSSLGDRANDETVDTPALSPEAGPFAEADIADDVYSLSAMLVWLFTGEQDQPIERVDQFRAKLQQWIPQSPQSETLIDGLCKAVEHALNSDRSERGTALDICQQLELVARAAGIAWPVEQGEKPTFLDDSAGVSPQQQADETLDDNRSSRGRAEKLPSQIGRFRIVRKIGAGGMGDVFEAEDSSDGTRVAIKLLSQRILDHPDAIRRFYKEGRLLGEINSPYVTNLIEVNEDAGQHYIAMEYVSGTDLRQLIRYRAPLEERVALSLIADAARGLVGAHELGMIHRDIKPANILLAFDGGNEHFDASLLNPTPQTVKQLRVKLSDFGLARQIDQSESMRMTHTGALLGTPSYMSPEQFANLGDVAQATDIYALGITLFEMLAGKPPFEAGDAASLMNMHCNEPAPPLQRFNPDASEATCAIINRALAKKPQDRYADAAQFLHEVDRLLRGDATAIEVHPHLPPHDPKKIFEEVFEWELKGSAEDLWPYVSNTDRINCAVGVPSVVYQTARDERGRLRKYGEFRMAGLQIGWEEHPFEWVEGQRLGILREFTKGPFEWFLSIVELIPLASGGTKLRHTVRINPRGLVGRLVATMEVTVKGKRALDRVYGRIDQSVTGQLSNAPTTDPFIEPQRLSKSGLQRLETRLDALAKHGIDPVTIEHFTEFLRDAPAQELGRIRPLAVARNYGLDGQQFVVSCLYAAREGLLNIGWDILCPTCRISARVTDTLKEIQQHERCEVCDLDFEVDMANSLELIFRAHPEIRAADVGTYCIGGPEHSPHVVVQIRLAPGERAELSPVLSEGEYVLRSAQLDSVHRLRVLPLKGTTRGEIGLSPEMIGPSAHHLRAGRIVLAITNDYDHEIVVRLERRIPLKDVFTAAQAAALPAFRDLFPEESFQSGRLLNVATVTLLAVDLADVDRLFDELGDAEVYTRVERFQQLVDHNVRLHSGALVHSLGTGALCAFDAPQEAISAVLSLHNDLNRPTNRDLQLHAGIHRGTVLATSEAGHLGYFGATTRITETLARQAQPGEVLLTETIAADPLVAALIEQSHLVSEVCDLPLPADQGHRCRRIRLG